MGRNSRSGNRLNPRRFMRTDEAPPKNDVVYKGNNVYSFFNSDQETIIIKNDDSSAETIGIKKIKDHLHCMRENMDKTYDELSEDHKRIFSDITRIYRYMQNTPSCPRFMEALHEAFSGVDMVKEMTVGAYFYGNFVRTPAGWLDNHYCSPVAATAVVIPTTDARGYTPCNTLVININKDGVMRILNEVPDKTNAVVSTQVRISNQMIDQLKTQGVKNVKIVQPNPDGSYRYLIRDFTALNNLNTKEIQSTGQSTFTLNNSWLGWIILIVIVIIILLILALLFSGRRR